MTTLAPARRRGGKPFSEQQLGALQQIYNRAMILAEVPSTLLTYPTFRSSTISIRPQGSQALNPATITGTGNTHCLITRLIFPSCHVHQEAGLMSQDLRVQMKAAWIQSREVANTGLPMELMF